ncbi:Serine/threonine-protein kinase pkn3 [Minicystis rosea]|nr:Serine/threonine-protein kinase pkn3 [Minicystis rosea]
MECLDEARLFELFTGEVQAADRDRVDVHLDGCEGCRALVAAYARLVDDTMEDGAPRPEEEAVETAPAPAEGGEAPSRFRVGDVVGGRYRLERIVGEGGMGVVWAARDLEAGRATALKVLKVDTPEISRRALREAQVTKGIGHPNVVEVRDVIAKPGAPLILVMDLLEGESLDGLLGRRGPLPVHEAATILLPLVAAVRAAHLRGVMHRDLKPQNVFLAREDEGREPVVMLLDFGLAKVVGHEVETLTRTGAIVGTPYYMAPEQLYGERDVDWRADVWAIGAIAYECLTGRRPIEGSSYAQILRNASRRRIEPLAAKLSGDIGTLVDRMLAHNREGRPSLAEVHAALDALARVT